MMKIILITGHTYPVGTALTNRIRSYLEVLADFGHEVKVVIYRPSEDRDNIRNDKQGKLNGVTYYSTAKSIIKTKNKLVARFTWIYGYLNCLIHLWKEEQERHIDIIIQGSSKSSIIPFVALFCKIYKAKFVLENNEYPWFILKKGKLFNLWHKFLYTRIYYRLFDAVLAMTSHLVKYHNRYSKKAAKIFHLPMTVDMKRFNLDIPRENNISYVGNVSYKKDGVDILLSAFRKIAYDYPDWKLMIIGDTSEDQKVRKYVEQSGLAKQVMCLGSVPRDDVPLLLCKSKILALARPNFLQSEGGFPTKLGEYLATGNLVVVTNVGDIPLYLQNEVSSLVAKADSVESFAQKLRFGIEHYVSLSKVRAQGHSVCKTHFNAEVQGARLSVFFEDLLK